MSEPYIGEIRIWANTFNPRGWAYCSGTSMSAVQNPALYAVTGTSFGGTPGSSFMGKGGAAGLTTRVYATAYGEMTHTLSTLEMAQHNHTLYANIEIAKEITPDNQALYSLAYNPSANKACKIYKSNTSSPSLMPMNPNTLAWNGNSQAHANMQPYIAIIYCIALDGVFPVIPS
jgi:microcystin-dependent protein